MHLRPARSIFRLAGAVLSVAKLALGQEAYYEQQVALGLAGSLEHLVPERRAQAGGRFGD